MNACVTVVRVIPHDYSMHNAQRVASLTSRDVFPLKPVGENDKCLKFKLEGMGG